MSARVRFAAPIVVLTAALLAGCPAIPRKVPSVEPWDTRRIELQERDRFALKARVAVAAGQDGFNARLRWNQEGPQSDLALDGPLGVGGVRVTSDGSALNVVTARGEQLDSERARDELNARLGFEPPLASLRFWVLGVPDPSMPGEEVLDEQQRLARLEQAGWSIDYDSYITVNGKWLPKRLTLRREDVRVRLLVDAWDS